MWIEYVHTPKQVTGSFSIKLNVFNICIVCEDLTWLAGIGYIGCFTPCKIQTKSSTSSLRGIPFLDYGY